MIKDFKTFSIYNISSNFGVANIDDDIILYDSLEALPLPETTSRTSGIIVGMCTEGSYSYIADGTKQTVKAGEIMIIYNGQVINGCEQSAQSEGIGIVMTYDFFQEIAKDVHELSALFLLSRTHPILNLQSKEVDAVLNYFSLMREKAEDTTNYFRKDVVRLLMSATICDLSNAIYRVLDIKKCGELNSERIFINFIKLVESHFIKERRVSWYSNELCITSKYLSEKVKQVSGCTPNEWIDRFVILEIRMLLKYTTKSIKQISADLNFPNQSFMGRFFRAHVGVSPLSYRHKLNN
ncbi:MAG: helix-turn-helix domain-containing protein [Prevotella sp.]|nr:helix-turn-helix domain-containing protein [Prevotella sp.]